MLVHAARAAPLSRAAPSGAGYPPDAVESRVTLSLAAGARLLDRVTDGGAVETERRVAIGPPAEVLHDIAAREAAVLLVVGSCVRGSVVGAVPGSVSADVIASAPRSVLAAPVDGSGRDG